MSDPLYLRVLEPGRADISVPIEQTMTLGRSRRNNFRLHSGTVSREHAVLVQAHDGWMIVNIAKDNTIRIVQDGKDQVLEERKYSPLTEGMSLYLGEVKCEVTRDPGTPRPQSTGFGSWFRSRSSISRSASRAPSPRNDGAMAVEETPAALVTGRGNGRKEAGESRGRPQSTKMGLVAAEGRLKDEPSASAPPPPATRSATVSPSASETFDFNQNPSLPNDIFALEAANPRLLILKEDKEELVRLKDRLQKKGERFECTLGRTPSTTGETGKVIISDESVSREHARIEFGKGVFTITDNRSRCGIAIAGRRDVPFYKVLQPPEKVPPGVPQPLSPDMHLRVGLVNVIFIADVDEHFQKVNFDEYRRAWDLVKENLTRQQRKRVLAKTKNDPAPHYGAYLLLEGGLVTPEVWFKHFFFALVVPPSEPGFFRRWWRSIW